MKPGDTKYSLLFLLLCLIVSLGSTATMAADITLRATDDAMQRGTTYIDDPYTVWSWWGSYDYVRIVDGNNSRTTGFRFDGVNIPKGATIERATLTFYPIANDHNRDTKVKVYGELSATPTAFSAAGTNLTGRTATSASVTWSGNDYGGLDSYTPDLSSVISEIVNLDGWATGNSLVLLTQRISSAWDARYDVRASSDSWESRRPTLTITYTDTPRAEIEVDKTSIGVTTYEGYSPSTGAFTLSEISGLADFIGTIAVSASWLTVSPTSFTSTSPLAAGSSKDITISYNTKTLAAGTYSATINISGNAKSDRTIFVTLLVKDVPASASCGEIPLYAQNVIDPAIMVELDTSGSMSTAMPILMSGENPRTSSLKAIVQEIVNRPGSEDPDDPDATIGGWQEGNDMAFVISGTSTYDNNYRYTYSYDGQSLGAAKLTITYLDDSGAEVDVEYQIANSEADVQQSGTTLLTGQDYLQLGRSGQPVGLLFENLDIPNGATIVDAEIQFVISKATSGTDAVTIQGVDLDTAPPFTTVAQLSENLTDASTNWNIESWGNTMPRIDIAEDVLAEVFEDRSISWGFSTWSGGYYCDSRDTPPTNDWTTFIVGIHEHDSAHQNYLQDHVDDGRPSGCTPLAPALHAGYQYFTGSRTDSTYGKTYTELDCQPRIVVMVTDGIGNTATTMALVEQRTKELLAEGISVVAVGFGIDEDDSAQLYRIAELAQVAGETDDEDSLYGLHRTNASGVGIPYLAQSREDFINAMTSIVSSVKSQVFYGSAPAATTSTDNGEVLLSASYSAADWTGEVTARKFNAYTGTLEDTPLWLASEKMPSTINGYIYNTSTGTITSYTDTSLTGDNYLCKPLGDIINSTPIIVSKPAYWYSFNDYFSFKYNSAVNSRQALAYVAANDGALHAFNLSSGEEEWRFYPEAVQAKMNMMASDPVSDMCSSSYCHKFLFDGSPQAADVYNGSSWRTVLLTGLGRGGSAYVALDVTYSNDFSTANTHPSSRLWEFTDSTLGLATSYPEIERVVDEINTKGASWIVLLGSGEMESYVDQLSQEAYLYGLNVFDKSPIWLDASDADIIKVKLSPTTLTNDVASSPVALDLNDDDLNDIVYLGNMYGNMYRVNNIGEGQHPDVSTFFYSGNTDHSQPITAKPAFAFISDSDNSVRDVWLYFGTGIYEETADKFSEDQQYFYGLFDDEGASSNTSHPEDATYVPSALYEFTTDIVVGYTVNTSGNRVDLNGDGVVNTDDMTEYRTVSCTSPVDGKCNSTNLPWKLALWTSSGNASERVVTQPLVVAGVVFFSTFIPDDDPCEGNGKSYLFAVDYKTGSFTDDAVFDLNGDGEYTEDDQTVMEADGSLTDGITGILIGEGKPTDLEIHNDILYAGTTNSPVKPIKVNLPGLSPRLKAWRQMIND